jgi:sodium-independent sulfate anion transporter 11
MRDLIAGITVGIVVVPQSMAYAKIAMLPPQYGL